MIKTQYEAMLADQKLFLTQLKGLLTNAQEAARKKFTFYCDNYKFGDDSPAAISAYLDYARTDERRRTIIDLMDRYERMFEL